MAAKLEGSKWFAKQFMQRHGIPTASASMFTQPEAALAYLEANGVPLVIKADGLASGKGVIVASTYDQAENAIRDCFKGVFGEAGKKVLLEEYMEGEEVSIMALVDRHTIIPLVTAQDHKQLLDGDHGPNTGGMGAYSTSKSFANFNMMEIKRTVLLPFLRGCQNECLDYRGIIYAGLMITESGPKVLEFNVRFGDPETQAILMRLETDLVTILLSCVNDNLSNLNVDWSDDESVCIVLVSPGYPGAYQTGLKISGIEAAQKAGAKIFHAGTKLVDGEWVTNGGRVLGVAMSGKSLQDVCQDAYQATAMIHWEGIHYRQDIGLKSIKRAG
jgi:phosphoribosylamine--glycine ligase